jgi:hypothetical protein
MTPSEPQSLSDMRRTHARSRQIGHAAGGERSPYQKVLDAHAVVVFPPRLFVSDENRDETQASTLRVVQARLHPTAPGEAAGLLLGGASPARLRAAAGAGDGAKTAARPGHRRDAHQSWDQAGGSRRSARIGHFTSGAEVPCRFVPIAHCQRRRVSIPRAAPMIATPTSKAAASTSTFRGFPYRT